VGNCAEIARTCHEQRGNERNERRQRSE
jgi:hypothetical protein